MSAVLQPLADKCAAQVNALGRLAPTWDDETYTRRRDALSARIDTLNAGLRASGRTLQDLGWEIRPGGAWCRVGEPTPTPNDPTGALLRETLGTAQALLVDVEQHEGDPLSAAWEAVELAAGVDNLATLQEACGRYLETARGMAGDLTLRRYQRREVA